MNVEAFKKNQRRREAAKKVEEKATLMQEKLL